MMTPVTAALLLNAITFQDWQFQIVGDFTGETYLQAIFTAPDADEPEHVSEQKYRKWLLSKHMTESELVQTAFLCVKTAVEHEMREQFKFEGMAIFGPHLNVAALYELCHNKSAFDRREEPTVDMDWPALMDSGVAA